MCILLFNSGVTTLLHLLRMFLTSESNHTKNEKNTNFITLKEKNKSYAKAGKGVILTKSDNYERIKT